MKVAEDALLEVDNLRTQFDTPGGLLTAVDGVSFSLSKGKSLGVVGESGSGKSVMSRSIMRLLPKVNIHTEGTVRFKSRNLMELAPRDLRKTLGTGNGYDFSGSARLSKPSRESREASS